MPDMVETMAYRGEVPWHGNGFNVTGDMSLEEILEVTGGNYEVFTETSEFTFRGKRYATGDKALFRIGKDKLPQVLSNVSDGWKPNQNRVALELFKEEVDEGSMAFETGGVLDEGRYFWMLAKTHHTFSLYKGKDEVHGYFLFVNPHKYGWSITTAFTPIRVVCMNTLMLAMSQMSSEDSDQVVRTSHRRDFVVKDVKEKMKLAEKKMKFYEERAKLLSKKRADDAAQRAYFKYLFPMVTKDAEKRETELSKAAQESLALVHTQPGAEMTKDSYWGLFNAATYRIDHTMGRNADDVDTRLTNAWFGPAKQMKMKAFNLAVELAGAA